MDIQELARRTIAQQHERIETLERAMQSIGATCEYTETTSGDQKAALDAIHKIARNAAPRQ